MYSPSRRPAEIQRRLLRWYARCGRDLPWRRTRDPYAVLVSEVMLQQTQVSRVLPAYAAFLERFPTLARLADASLGDVLRVWGRLGYPRRARDLQRAARLARAGLPSGREALDALPGVGRYTAGAVACFAHGRDEAFADTNIARVLGRAVLGAPADARAGEALDAALLPAGGSARWHHALMDLGATVCTARAPRCTECPLADICVAYRRGAVPVPVARRQAAFRTSDRRVRGEILRVLRGRPEGTSLGALTRAIGDSRVPVLVAALAEEGLLERAGRRVRLPA
ncbi:MAG TPA: A/G-specific adenine glycosylase [Candidatus Limnocylindria bacterium]|nr:A/G-specific adenine glycosylase [Candidatus Limnocylindria bacterium]